MLDLQHICLTTAVQLSLAQTVSRASADYETYNINTAIESGKDIRLPYATTLTPYLGIDYIHSKRSDFTETGAGAANL